MREVKEARLNGEEKQNENKRKDTPETKKGCWIFC